MNSVALKLAAYEENQNDLVIRHAPLVKRIAYHLLARLPDTVQVDDLIQSGMIGLLEAVRNYENGHGASFATYAGIRIRGAMLDEVRRNDWTPRSVHRRSREIAEAIRQIEAREGRDAHDSEIARLLGVDLDEYYRMLQDASASRVLSFEDMGYDGRGVDDLLSSGEPEPSDELARKERSAGLAAAVEQLPERERLVMSLYYGDELNLKEIGKVLGVTESRVCQIHSQALVRIRARMSSAEAVQ